MHAGLNFKAPTDRSADRSILPVETHIQVSFPTFTDAVQDHGRGTAICELSRNDVDYVACTGRQDFRHLCRDAYRRVVEKEPDELEYVNAEFETDSALQLTAPARLGRYRRSKRLPCLQKKQPSEFRRANELLRR